MKKTAILTARNYFSTYIDLAGDGDLITELEHSLRELDHLDMPALERVGDRTYALGKWTLKQLIQHMTDAERIFQYRALRFARNDQTSLPGFEQDDYAEVAEVMHRQISDLLDEFRTVRQSSIVLFRNLSDEALLRTGMASGNQLSVLGVGFLIVGHQLHHLKIIRDRYLPLAER